MKPSEFVRRASEHYHEVFLADQLAARGYAVLIQPANPSALVGDADAPLRYMAEMTTDAVDALVKTGYADPNRLGIYGASQGGYAALWLATQTDRFRAVVSADGWSDLVTHYLGAGLGEALLRNGPFYGEAARYHVPYGLWAGTVGGIGRSLWEAPEVYTRNSPVFLADKISSPILLIHSDLDAFSLSQYDEMYASLSILGKEATYVRYMGEAHVRSSPANARDQLRRIMEFFNKHLRS